jgi:hypothetical protein
MLFEEIIAVLYRKLYETHKYKMQRYWFLKPVVNIVTSNVLSK